MPLKIKRIYDPVDKSDGIRLLVDRLWPRGVFKDKAQLDGWMKELAPSPRLRAWFGHQAENFPEFSVLYRAELDASAEAQAAAKDILQQSRRGTVTLLYGARDRRVNHAVVLLAYLEEQANARKPARGSGRIPRRRRPNAE